MHANMCIIASIENLLLIEKFKYSHSDKSIMSIARIKEYIPKLSKIRNRQKNNPVNEDKYMELLMAYESSIRRTNFTEAEYYEKMLDKLNSAKKKIPN
jgi:hypothetical protein